MNKTNNLFLTIIFLGTFFFVSGYLFKSGIEKEDWFKYALKYDQARSNLIKNAENERGLKYLSQMHQWKKKLLQAKQPTETEIISTLNSSDKKLQRTGLTAMSLKPLETAQVFRILIKFLQDQDFYFKTYACTALDNFTTFPESEKGQLEKQLLLIIKNEELKGNKGIAFQEFSLLSKVPSPETALFLKEQLIKEGKENRIVRLAAFEALKKMGDPYYEQAMEYVKNNAGNDIQKEVLDMQIFDNDPNRR